MAIKPKKSKRYGLTKLADNWREIIFESIKSERLKLAVAVLSSTGCRPVELEKGVILRIKNDQLQIGIEGAKCDKESGRGQPLRLLVIDTNSPWGAHLLNHVVSQKSQVVKINYDAGGISQRLREKSREIWPRRKNLVSAYSYRHFLGKSLKESGISSITIASALGHATDYSQTCYGRAGSGKHGAGLHGILGASATNPIRHSSKSDRLDRFLKPNCEFSAPFRSNQNSSSSGNE